MLFNRYSVWLVCLGIFSFIAQPVGLAQSAKTSAAPASAAPSNTTSEVLSLVPSNAVFCLSIRLQQIAQDPALAFLPWEVISGASVDAIGVDALKIDRLDWIGNWTLDNELGVAVMITTTEKVTLDQLKPECFIDKTIPGNKGRIYRPLADSPMSRASVCALGDRLFAWGQMPLVENLLDGPPEAGALRQQMLRIGEASHVTFIATPEPARLALREALQSAPKEIKDDLLTLTDKIQVVAAKSQVGTSLSMPVLIETASENDAQAVEDSWNRGVKYALAQWRTGLAQSTFQSGVAANENPFLAYSARAGKDVTKQLTPTRKGSRLLLKLDDNSFHLARGIMTATNLVPAMGGLRMSTRENAEPSSTRRPSRQAASSSAGAAAIKSNAEKSLATINLAVMNFESKYRVLPSTGIQDVENGTQLSWRVSLLPFMGQQKLYDKFKLDEPWDSKHNIKLLKEMPEVYRYTRSKAKPGYTVFHRPTGPGLASQAGMKYTYTRFIDGMSNTIYVAITTDEAAVPWTKPDDFNPVENPELLRDDGGSYLFCMTSGEVVRLPSDLSPAKLNAFFTCGAGDLAER